MLTNLPCRGLLRDCGNRLWNRWIVLQHYPGVLLAAGEAMFRATGAVTSVTSHPALQLTASPTPCVSTNKTMGGHEDTTLSECDMGWCNQNYPPHSYDQNRLPESSSISSSSSPPMMMAAICRCPGGHSSAFTNNYLNTEHRSVVSSPYCPNTHRTGETLYCPLTKCLLTGNQ